jgi:hypothetical protein
MRPRTVLAILALVAASAGCTASVAPVVKDVRVGKDGAIVVEQCTLNVAPGLFGSQVYYDNCHTRRATEPSPTGSD